MIVDMHCDTISRLLNDEDEGRISNLYENDYHIDLKKLLKGNYLCQNFAIFTPFTVDNPMMYALRMIDKYYNEIDKYADIIKPAYSYQDIIDNYNDHKISSILTLEEGAVVNNDLRMLRNYYRLGVRMITLTWNYPNGIGHPNFSYVYDGPRYDMLRQINDKDGLEEFGIEYIKEMERLGIIIDVSHLSDAGFWDVVKYSTKPFVASHSNARSICNVARNLTDEMIIKMRERNCVIGLNYCADFVDNDGNGSIEKMIEHIDHIIKVGGEDILGLGSDFDGIKDRQDLRNAQEMSDLISALKDHGYSDELIDKITYKNVLRLYKEVLR